MTDSQTPRLKPPRSLRDQIALVTGATGAIGGAVALGLAREGARIVPVGRDREALEAISDACRSGGSPEVDPHAVDLTDDAHLRRLAGRVKATFGGVDIVVHSAGLFAAGTVAEAPVEDLDRQLAVNLRAPYLLTQLLLPSLLERRGQVVFINSTAGTSARATVGAYAASKFALRALADSLRDEVSGNGVRVVTVFPGRTASEMQQQVKKLEGKPYDPDELMDPGDVAHTVLAALTLPPTAELPEVTVVPARTLPG